ncbi:MAG: hypothetical protein RL095_2187 [Verrucomicrobiota bacterium]|jgi:hypothetical protein
MRIANPIYDSVFKYLMSDPAVARLIIATITEMDIESLEPSVNEHITEVHASLVVYRLDFRAKVRLPDGTTQLILIEVQKAKLPDDVMRFRRYIGEQYAHPDNCVVEKHQGRDRKTALPILSIYFLAYPIDGIETPVLRIRRGYFDAITREELKIRSPFVEGLTHDSIVIQVSRLHEKARTPLEQLLGFFDQQQLDPEDSRQLIVDEDGVPEQFRSIARILLRATQSAEVRKRMILEDEYLKIIQDEERDKLAAFELLEKERQLRLHTESELKQAEAKLADVLRAAQREKLASAEALLQLGLSDEQMLKATGLSALEIRDWIAAGRP